jgi:hypothetical protein
VCWALSAVIAFGCACAEPACRSAVACCYGSGKCGSVTLLLVQCAAPTGLLPAGILCTVALIVLAPLPHSFTLLVGGVPLVLRAVGD